MLGVLTFTLLLAAVNGEDCILIPKGVHGKSKIRGFGLHRQLDIPTFIQAQQRVPQCRLLYKIELPNGAYVDERELNSSTPGYDFVVDRHDLYVVRRKLFLSTFEMKDRLSIKFHLEPPSKANPKNMFLDQPEIAFDCKGEKFEECQTLRVPNVPILKPNYGRWLVIDPEFARTIDIEMFREGYFSEDYPVAAIYIFCATLVFSLGILTTSW